MRTLVGSWGAGAVWQLTTGSFSSNAYFCEADVPGGGILVDPGLDPAAIDAHLDELGVRPHQVVCTHGHFDHTGGAAWFQDKYGCEVFLHRADARVLRSSNFLLMALGFPERVRTADVVLVDDDFSLDVGGHPLDFLPAPGHTPGSCVLALGDAWFTGDTVYRHGLGLSKLPGADTDTLRTSVERFWPGLTDDRLVCPGHGPAADGGAIRRGNVELGRFLAEPAR